MQEKIRKIRAKGLVGREALEEGKYNANCRLSDKSSERIVCRHITRGTLLRAALLREYRTLAGYLGIKHPLALLLQNADVEDLKQCPARSLLKRCPAYAERFLQLQITENGSGFYKSVGELHFFYQGDLRRSLAEIAKGLRPGDMKLCELLTENHSMFLSVSRKVCGAYRITFKDPNQTNLARHVIVENLTNVSLSQIIPAQERQERYFPRLKCGVIRVFDEDRLRELSKTGIVQQQETFLSQETDLEEIIQLYKRLDVDQINLFRSFLFFALRDRFSAANIQKVFDGIVDNKELFENKEELLNILESRDKTDTPNIFYNLSRGNKEAVKAFMQGLDELQKQGVLSQKQIQDFVVSTKLVDFFFFSIKNILFLWEKTHLML